MTPDRRVNFPTLIELFPALAVLMSGAMICVASGSVNKGNQPQLPLETPPPQPPAELFEGQELLPTPPPQATPEGEMERLVSKIEAEEGYDCEPIPKGSWLIRELRERGAPGIDEGPYILIRRGGLVETYETYSELPSLVYPNEQFCIKRRGSSSIIPEKEHGVIFENNRRAQNNKTFQQKSLEITSRLRAKQGF